MALTLNTTVLPGQTVVTDSTTGGIAIDYTTLYGRIATALETIATNSTAIKNSLSAIATSQGTIATNHALIATSQGTIALKQTSLATDLTFLKSLATNDGLKIVSPYDWLSSATSAGYNGNTDELTASLNRIKSISNLIPRFQ